MVLCELIFYMLEKNRLKITEKYTDNKKTSSVMCFYFVFLKSINRIKN